MERNGAVLRRGFGLLCKLMKTEKFFFSLSPVLVPKEKQDLKFFSFFFSCLSSMNNLEPVEDVY